MIKTEENLRNAAWEEIYRVLEKAGQELYSFTAIAFSSNASEAETLVLDCLFLALERGWLVRNEKNHLTYEEFREELFTTLWQRMKKQIYGQLPGKNQGRFYELPLPVRAALYLRSRAKFSERAIARVIEIPEADVFRLLAEGRRALLGHELRPFELDEAFG